jgi:hypothetical protein
VTRLKAVQPPGFALCCPDEPEAPVAVTIGLVLQELLPGDRARIVDDLARRIRASLHDPDELRVERAEELRLVADELGPATTAGGAHDAVVACAVSKRPRVRSVCGPAKNGCASGFALQHRAVPQNSLRSRDLCGFLRVPDSP